MLIPPGDSGAAAGRKGAVMAQRVPEPTRTPEGPRYEGRLLDRPDEEIVDQGARFDIRTILSRRSVITAFGLGVGVFTLAACTTDGTAVPTSAGSGSSAGGEGGGADSGLPAGEIPDETAGPYPGDGSNGPDVLEESGIVRSDIRSSIGKNNPVDGVPLEFTITVTDLVNGDAPFAGVAVYAWHCDAQGRYSMYSEGVESESWLRGVQVADAKGQVTFTSVVPGCYPGRWTHIHFEVYPDQGSISDSANAIATSQLALPEDMLGDVYELPVYAGSADNLAQLSLETDNVFGDDGGELQLAAVSGDASQGFRARLTARVDTSTTPTGGAMPGGGGVGGAGGPGGTPPSAGAGPGSN